MSARFITTLCDLEKTIDRVSTYTREELECPPELRSLAMTITTALDQVRELLCTLGQDLADVERVARRADRQAVSLHNGGLR